MTTLRINMRIDEAVKTAGEKAATLQGMRSFTEYVTRLIEEDAKQVIEAHESIKLEPDVFDRFMAACEAAEGPNEKLKAAFKYTDQKGIR